MNTALYTFAIIDKFFTCKTKDYRKDRITKMLLHVLHSCTKIPPYPFNYLVPTGNKTDGNKNKGNKNDGNKNKGNKNDGNKKKGNKNDGNKKKGNKNDGNVSVTLIFVIFLVLLSLFYINHY